MVEDGGWMLGDGRPIGVFDSGIGGLSVWREIARRLAHEDTIYFADQVHIPYGPRTLEQIREFSEAITCFLLDHDCKLIVVACNTASAAALKHLRATFPDVSFVGMEPAVKPAAQSTRTRVVGVLATPATFQGSLFASVVERFANGVELINQVCPGLVERIEAGEIDAPETETMLRGFLQPLVDARADTIVLACTHYPFVTESIQRIAGSEVVVIDPAPAIARQVARVLDEHELNASRSNVGRHVFYSSGDLTAFKDILSRLVNVQDPALTVMWQDGRVVEES